MNIFRFPQILKVYSGPDNEPIRYTFCSKRLAKLMLEKSRNGVWRYPYFPTKRFVLFPGFVTVIISNHGLLIMAAEK